MEKLHVKSQDQYVIKINTKFNIASSFWYRVESACLLSTSHVSFGLCLHRERVATASSLVCVPSMYRETNG